MNVKSFVCPTVVWLLVLLTPNAAFAITLPIDFTSQTFAVRAIGTHADSGNQPRIASIFEGFPVNLGVGQDAAIATYGELRAGAVMDCISCASRQFSSGFAALTDTIQASGFILKGQPFPVTITEVLEDTFGSSFGGDADDYLRTVLSGLESVGVKELTISGGVYNGSAPPVSPRMGTLVVQLIADSDGVTTFTAQSFLSASADAIGEGFAFVNALGTGKIFLDAGGCADSASHRGPYRLP